MRARGLILIALASFLFSFAQFFIAPLFTESATEREINAVDSEHEKNIPNDLWRMDQLDKHTADPSHPYHKFGSGNKKTLFEIPKANGINVRDELLKFHDTWYSANIMALAVTGKGKKKVTLRIAVETNRIYIVVMSFDNLREILSYVEVFRF